MRFGNAGVFWGIAIFFLVAGAAFVVLGSSEAVTDIVDANSTADSDPAGDVFPLLGGIWMAVAVLLLVIGFGIRAATARDNRLQRSGTTAPARIDEVSTTGVIMNNVAAGVKLSVTVRPRDGREFQAKLRTYVPVNDLPLAGEEILVAYDPSDPSRLTPVSAPGNAMGGAKVLVAPGGEPLWQARRRLEEAPAAGADGRAAGLTPVEQLERLAALRERGVLTAEEFDAQKQRLLAQLG